MRIVSAKFTQKDQLELKQELTKLLGTSWMPLIKSCIQIWLMAIRKHSNMADGQENIYTSQEF